MERSKGSRLKGWIESPNALRWRLGQLLGCAFTEAESSKIIIRRSQHGLMAISQRQPARKDAFSDLVLLLRGTFRGVVSAGEFLRFLRR
jgi:hypothetical protein